MSPYITITVTDPDLPTPVVVQLSRHYVEQRRLDVVAAYFARAMDEYLLRAGWDIKPPRSTPSNPTTPCVNSPTTS